MLDYTELNWTLLNILDFAGLYRNIWEYTGHHWTILDKTRLYRTIPDFNRQLQATLDYTGLYWTIFDYNGQQAELGVPHSNSKLSSILGPN